MIYWGLVKQNYLSVQETTHYLHIIHRRKSRGGQDPPNWGLSPLKNMIKNHAVYNNVLYFK